jgi:hypothetical protein
MTQLRLVYSKNSNALDENVMTIAISSSKRRTSRGGSSTLSPLARKSARLQQLAPKAAAVIERLVDDMLEEIAVVDGGAD